MIRIATDVENAALEIVKAVVARVAHPAVVTQGRTVEIKFDATPPGGAGSADSSQWAGHLREAVARLMGTRSDYERLPSRESDASLVCRRRARD